MILKFSFKVPKCVQSFAFQGLEIGQEGEQMIQ